MGRVFSYEAVAAGKVPRPDDFDRARKLFLERVGEESTGGAIDGGFIFGSVCRGTADLRSDFDALIALRDGSPHSYKTARDITQYIADDSGGKILIEPIVYSKSTLATGQHELNQLFGQHLLSGFRLVEGNDPATYITFPDMQVRDVLADYIYQKARKLSNKYVTSDPREVADNGLQRMLELPNSLGRKTLQVLSIAGHLEEAAEASEKTAIFQQSDELFRRYDLHEGFRDLANANDMYTELLREAIDGQVDKQTYDDVLVGLHDKMPAAIEWTRAVGRVILPLFDQHV